MSQKRTRVEEAEGMEGLIRLPDYVVEKAKEVLLQNNIDLDQWKGVFLVGGAACTIVQRKELSATSDLDFLVSEDWAEKDNPIRQWASSTPHDVLVESNSGSYLHPRGEGKRKMQLFPMKKVKDCLEQFDLAPCRVAIGSEGAFCTEDALYAFATGVCKNSCGNEDRLAKYEERGFITEELPEFMEGRAAWRIPDYTTAAQFIYDLLE